MQVPTEDRFLMSRSELLNKIATLLGGRASEEIIFGDISTGAHNDLAKATDIARSMVKEYGMSDKIGQVYFERRKKGPYFEVGLETAEYSEATAELIDNEVRDIVQRQYEISLAILRAKRPVLENGARLLLEKEKIEGEELKKLMEKTPDTPSDGAVNRGDLDGRGKGGGEKDGSRRGERHKRQPDKKKEDPVA